MKRLDIKVTDNANEVLEGLKESTERSKTELVHDAIGLLWLTQKAYAVGHAIGEIDPDTGEVINRFLMPMFEGTRRSSEEEKDEYESMLEAWRLHLAELVRMAKQGTPIPVEKLEEEEKTLADVSAYMTDLRSRPHHAMRGGHAFALGLRAARNG